MPAPPVVSSTVQPKSPIDGSARDELGSAGSEEVMDTQAPVKQSQHEVHINSVVDSTVDLELAISDDVTTQKTTSSWCLRRRRLVACGLCCLLFTVALAVCVPLFWPRDASWELTNITVNSTALNEFVGMFSIYMALPSNASHFPPLPELNMVAEVDLHNPNYLGGKMLGPGDFTVFFHGQIFGSGQCSPAMIEPQSNTLLTCNVATKMQPQTFKDIITDILEGQLKRPLTVQVSGGTKVQGPLGIELKAGATCDVHASVMAFMDPARRGEVVESSECRYSYF
eukprot:TRINITY_DN10354_c0_g1_i1.p1 TRINITY_DN10354_c0_g1~~TRINITY_DN10354_c0_g1_i1.p1  ORF type:complete len:283 (+),score=37.88 TRINITY_DN10354_c0_g1_i1:97-945(+)